MATDNPIEAVMAFAQSLEEVGDAGNSTRAVMETIPGVMGELGKSASVSSENVTRFAKEMFKFGKETDGLKSKLESLFSGSMFGDPLAKLFSSGSAKKIETTISGAVKDAVGTMHQAFETLKMTASDTTGAVAAIGTIGFAAAKVEAMESLKAYIGLEKQLMEMQKAALQMGMSFGEGFKEADDSVSFFESSMLDTMRTLQATDEELKKTRGVLKEAFSAREMFDSIEGLDASVSGVKSTINLTNVALAVSRSTGMDVADVAKRMTDMHLMLGSSLEDTALAFGHIKDAAKDSGLTYETVSSKIIESAKSLKYYGATVESISPVFKAFNQSLKGIGKEGLTPELLGDFVSGLQQMQMGTRALLGLRMPGAGGTGILGGALRVEQAMETGEGMGDVIKSISETMKKFGGQQLLTREEALKNPAAERNFVIQRQILGMLTGIKDAGKQNQMMKILSDIDSHGMAGSKTAEDKFNELMSSGEKVADETTDSLTKAQLEYQRTRISQGDEFIKQLKILSSTLGLTGLAEASTKLIDTAASSQGKINFDVMGDLLKDLVTEQENLRERLQDKSLDEKTRAGLEGSFQQTTESTARQELESKYVRAIIEAKEGLKPGEKLSGEAIANIMSQAQSNVLDRIQEIDSAIGEFAKDSPERRALVAEKTGLKDALSEFRKFNVPNNLPKGMTEEEFFSEGNILSREKARKEREATGLASIAMPKPRGATRTTEEGASAKSEVNGTIVVKLQIDSEGRLITEDRVVEIVNGEIRGDALGTKGN